MSNPSSATGTAQSASRFQCHICVEPSEMICGWCTKDACPLHLCEKCARCSDCCACENDKQRQRS